MSDPWTEQVTDPSFLRGLDQVVLTRRRRFRDDSSRPARFSMRGGGLEWVGHRRYQPGDDLRHLDWHLLARLGRPYVRQFLSGHAERLDLLIDTSRSMTLGHPPKADVGRALAFVFGYVASSAGDRVASACYSSGLSAHLPAGRGPAHRARLLGFLAAAPSGGRTSLASSVEAFIDHNREVSQVVVLSDLLDDTVESGLTMLCERGFEVTVVRLVAECDERPEVPDGSALLVDAETGATRHVVLSPQQRERYRIQRHAESERIARFCAGSRIAFADVKSWRPLPRLVFADMRAAGLLC